LEQVVCGANFFNEIYRYRDNRRYISLSIRYLFKSSSLFSNLYYALAIPGCNDTRQNIRNVEINITSINHRRI